MTDHAPRIPLPVSDLNPVEEAVGQRRSVRGFKPDPVPRETVKRILQIAARAPSGTNMQPWKVHVLTGKAREDLSMAIMTAFDSGEEHKGEWAYYPKQFREPYLARRRKVGWDLYGLVGIAKGDSEKMHVQHGRNYTFFDAPVGLVFTIDRDLEIGSWLDYGMFLQNVMLVARSHGLETCPQAAFAPYHTVIRKTLGLDELEAVVCGMSLGYADWERPENTLITERAPLDDFVTFRE
ncbi:nitroreductase [Thalassobaculum salexigens]|uniref:nitroreductase n=1 Tax=Thalassobaculum salexigens TaxID=455360 RepID=UPI0003FD034B|nr:nitroreductase [Thalassobaculum salexigens]